VTQMAQASIVAARSAQERNCKRIVCLPPSIVLTLRILIDIGQVTVLSPQDCGHGGAREAEIVPVHGVLQDGTVAGRLGGDKVTAVRGLWWVTGYGAAFRASVAAVPAPQ
jgi:hypothetical protein